MHTQRVDAAACGPLDLVFLVLQAFEREGRSLLLKATEELIPPILIQSPHKNLSCAVAGEEVTAPSIDSDGIHTRTVVCNRGTRVRVRILLIHADVSLELAIRPLTEAPVGATSNDWRAGVHSFDFEIE